MPRRRLFPRIAGLFAALAIGASATLPASADDFLKKVTFEVAPTFFGTGTTDTLTPPLPGTIPLGYTQDHPTTADWRVNYGLNLQLTDRTSLSYNHTNFDFTLGVITSIPGVSLASGDIADRTDTISMNYNPSRLLKTRAYYFDHERTLYTGLCLNQTTCAGKVPNPLAIDEHGFGVGGTWTFGPRTAIGPIFSFGADAKYIPRSLPGPTGLALDGLGKYTGSQFEFPYSITMKVPTIHDPSLIWVAGAERATALFRGESSIEQYNVTQFGVVKVLSSKFSVSAFDLNFRGCRCTDTVPPPDNVRFASIVLSLSYKFGLPR